MKKLVWRWDWGVYMSFCPYCDEPVSGDEHCEFCGKAFEYVEPKYKPTVVEVGEYTVIQTTGKSVYIVDKDGHWVYHASCTKKFTEDELRKMVDIYLALIKHADDILKDED